MNFQELMAPFATYYESLGLSAEIFFFKSLQENNMTILTEANAVAVSTEDATAVEIISRTSPYFSQSEE